MSLKSWKKEFYSPISRCPKSKALEHSIKKWEGALPENLEKHGCKYSYYELCDTDSNYMEFGASTCALCVKYCRNGCSTCDIVIYTGKTCDGEDSPFQKSNRDPQPMLNLLYRIKHLRDLDKGKKKV